MKKITQLLATSIIFLFLSPVLGQEIEEIDYSKIAAGDVQLPFDKEIGLAIPVNPKLVDPNDVQLIELFGPERRYRKGALILPITGTIKEDKKNKQHNLRLVLPPLRPNRSYSIGISTKVSGQELKALLRGKFELEKILMDKTAKEALEKLLTLERQLYTTLNVFSKDVPKNISDEQIETILYPTYKKALNKAQYDLLKYLENKLSKDPFNLGAPENSRDREDALRKSIKWYVEKKPAESAGILKQAKELDITPLHEFLKQFILFADSYDNNNITSSIFNLNEFKDFCSKVDIKEPAAYTATDKDLIKILQEISVACDSCNQKSLSNLRDYNDLSRQIQNLSLLEKDATSFTNYSDAKVVEGLLQLAQNSLKTTSKDDYEGRVASIKSNLEFLKKIRFILKLNEDSDNQTILETLISESNEQLKYLQSWVTKFQENSLTKVYKWVDGRTVKEELETESTNIVHADYGVLYADPGGQIIRPYFGINIGIFGPMNKNIRYRYLRSKRKAYGLRNAPYSNHWLRHHLSINLGATLGSIQQDNVRDDLFGKNNLIAGLNYRANRFVRASVGLLFYNLENSNPLIDEKKINTDFYVSLSFDLSLQKPAQKFAGAFFQ